MSLLRKFSVSCSALAISCVLWGVVPAFAQTASNEALYKMIMDLRGRQQVLERQLKAATSDASRANAELKSMRVRLGGKSPVHSGPALPPGPDYVTPIPATGYMSASAPAGPQAISALNGRLELGGGSNLGGTGFGYGGASR
jgi:hypothetical protein